MAVNLHFTDNYPKIKFCQLIINELLLLALKVGVTGTVSQM